MQDIRLDRGQTLNSNLTEGINKPCDTLQVKYMRTNVNRQTILVLHAVPQYKIIQNKQNYSCKQK